MDTWEKTLDGNDCAGMIKGYSLKIKGVVPCTGTPVAVFNPQLTDTLQIDERGSLVAIGEVNFGQKKITVVFGFGTSLPNLPPIQFAENAKVLKAGSTEGGISVTLNPSFESIGNTEPLPDSHTLLVKGAGVTGSDSYDFSTEGKCNEFKDGVISFEGESYGFETRCRCQGGTCDVHLYKSSSGGGGDPPPEEKSKGLSGGAVAGIAIAMVVVGGVLGVVIAYFVLKPKKQVDPADASP
jgi:hypothetical protein